jgi:hypothetical protein
MQSKRRSPPGRLSPEAVAHWERCRQLPPFRAGECEQLVTAYLSHRPVTICPARHVAPTEQWGNAPEPAH